jgi:hypothetical protein
MINAARLFLDHMLNRCSNQRPQVDRVAESTQRHRDMREPVPCSPNALTTNCGEKLSAGEGLEGSGHDKDGCRFASAKGSAHW